MSNSIKLTFAGDSQSLEKSAARSEQAVGGVGDAADASGKQLAGASKSSTDLATRMGSLGASVSGASDALDSIGGSLQAVADLQQAGAARASRLARALADVEQAQEDFNQALRDGAQSQLDSNQAAIDLEQANLDAAAAINDYNAAVKEHGANSMEARQAQLDLKQAQQDAMQANEDAAQAVRDGSQALIDAKTAQLDLADAQREAKPPELQKWADQLGMVTPLLTAVVGVVGLATAAQWLWNVAMTSNPIGVVIMAVAALVAGIIWLATQTTFFQDRWNEMVTGFKFGVELVTREWNKVQTGFKFGVELVTGLFKQIPDRIRSSFSGLVNIISWPFRTAFNLVSDAWNNTVGKLRWTVPGWVPGVGGNTVAAPRLPKFHSGGVVPGSLGQEVLAVLQAGETVTPAGGSSGSGRGLTADDLRGMSGTGLDRIFLSWLEGVLRSNNLALVRR